MSFLEAGGAALYTDTNLNTRIATPVSAQRMSLAYLYSIRHGIDALNLKSHELATICGFQPQVSVNTSSSTLHTTTPSNTQLRELLSKYKKLGGDTTTFSHLTLLKQMVEVSHAQITEGADFSSGTDQAFMKALLLEIQIAHTIPGSAFQA